MNTSNAPPFCRTGKQTAGYAAAFTAALTVLVLGILSLITAGAFAAEPVDKPADFRFVHITDTHATVFPDDIAEINALAGPLAFIVITGDLVPADGNDPEQFKTYRETISQFRAPVHCLPGNHDYSTGPTGAAAKWPEGVQNYLAHMGPNYFTFDHGGWHFIALDSQMPFADQQDWLREALARQPADRPIIVLQHKDPVRELLDFLRAYNVKALFHGHRHATKLYHDGNLKVICTPPLVGGNADFNPRGFRVVHLRGDDLTTEMRISGVAQQLTIVSPPEEIAATLTTVPIRVTGYDTSAVIVRCEYRLDEGPWEVLEPAGGWLYAGEYQPPPTGHRLTVRVTDDQGRILEKQRMVKAVAKPTYEIRWSAHAGGKTGYSTPVLHGGHLYLGVQDDDNGRVCGVTALDAGTGERRWRFAADSSINGAVAVGEGVVCAVSVAGTVYGIAADSGEGIWTYQIGDASWRWLYNAPSIMDDTVYVGGPITVALEVAGGAEKWTKSLGLGREWQPLRAAPQATAAELYVNVPLGGLFALNRESGETLWNHPAFGNLFPDPVVAADAVYFAGAQKTLFAVDAKNGEDLWQRELDRRWVPSSPAVKDSRLVIGLDGAALGAFDRHTGKPLWRRQYSTASPIGTYGRWRRGGLHTVTSPVIAGDTVYLGSPDGRLYAFELSTGEPLWEIAFGVPVLSKPVVANGLIYLSTFDGNLYCIAIME